MLLKIPLGHSTDESIDQTCNHESEHSSFLWWCNGEKNIPEMGTGSSLCMQCHGVVFAHQPKGQSVDIGYFLYLTYGKLEGVTWGIKTFIFCRMKNNDMCVLQIPEM